MKFIAYSDITIDGLADTAEAAIQEAVDAIYPGMAPVSAADWLAYCQETGSTPDFRTAPATDALAAQVEHEGGSIAWEHLPDGTACTVEEYEALQS